MRSIWPALKISSDDSGKDKTSLINIVTPSYRLYLYSSGSYKRRQLHIGLDPPIHSRSCLSEVGWITLTSRETGNWSKASVKM